MLNLLPSKFLGQTKCIYQSDTVIVSNVQYNKPVSEDWHFHDRPHISLYLQGGNSESRKKKEIETKPGIVTCYNMYELHKNKKGFYPTKVLNIEFKNDFFLKYDLAFTHFKQAQYNNPDIKFSLLKIYNECLTNDCYSKTSADLTLLSLFNVSENDSYLKIIIPSWLNTLKEILHDRLDEFVSLKELSEELKIHPVTISKYFPVYFNCTFGEYMRKIKVEKSLELLKNSSYNLVEISNICGFADQSHFIRTFKSYTSFLPSTYRKL